MRYGAQAIFAVAVAILGYLGLGRDNGDTVTDVKSGIGSICIFMLFYAMLTPSTPLKSPNEGFWRVITMVVVIYVCFIVFLLNLTAKDARFFMTYWDAKLNVQLEEGFENYDVDCDFSIDRLFANMDHYFLVHIINWYLAALVLRDSILLHIWSILDEILEVSAGHYMPHFRECWWDSWICDVFMTNTPAIIMGILTLRLFGWEKYDFFGRHNANSWREWKIWGCHRHFEFIIMILVFVSVNFLMGFFIMNALWINPKNSLNKIRLLVWFGMAMLGFREAWDDVKTWNTPLRANVPVHC